MPKHAQTPSTHRFFCDELPIISSPEEPQGTSPAQAHDALISMDRQESHHARNVLRLSAGAPIELFNGQGTLATATIEDYQDARALCRITSIQQQPPITPSLTIASAVPKGPRADAMITQLSQLGVDRFIPLIAEHSVAVPRPNKIERFAKSTIESAKQCRRLHLMHIDEPLTTHDACTQPGYDLKLIATPNTPADEPSPQSTASEKTLVLIGPEGGFSPAECADAADAGCRPWTFAPHILRIETAATAAAAILRYPAPHP